MVIPPSFLIASSPSVPSEAEPERITPIACGPWSVASDSRKKSIPCRVPPFRFFFDEFKAPPWTAIIRPGGMT